MWIIIFYFVKQSTFMIFNSNYFIFFALLLLVELLIAIHLHDAPIRPYGGDFLVVTLIYCFIKSFLDTSVMKTAIGVLIFSYAVEISQYFHLARVLGLQHYRVALLILGGSFSFSDLMCYTMGILLVLLIERVRISRKLSF